MSPAKDVYFAVNQCALASLSNNEANLIRSQSLARALWTTEVLPSTDYRDVEVTAKHGLVSLRGHVATAANKAWAGKAVQRVPGVVAIENYLIVDDELVIDVVRLLSRHVRTRNVCVQVKVERGIVCLSGELNSADLHTITEEVVATIPQVRGIVNQIQAPGSIIKPDEPRIVQPCIGDHQSVQSACDGYRGTPFPFLFTHHYL